MLVETPTFHEPSDAAISAIKSLGRLSSFTISGVATFALTVTAFIESFHSARLAVVFAVLILLHLMRYQKVLICREVVIYAVFFCYMLVQLLWAPDTRLSMNTIVPAASCVLAMVLFSSLIAYHDSQTVLLGMLGGFLLGAATYTATTGFPFSYPSDFSYNAIASMYLFGLVIVMLAGLGVQSRIGILAVAAVILLHIVMTTSIKSNLGILFGAIGASVLYTRNVFRILRRYATLLIAVTGLLTYYLVTSTLLMEMLQRGYARVLVGLQVLQARDDVSGYGSMGRRNEWRADGLDGWLQNPVFGNGPEAFRSQFGITSHSTYVDILYNSGLIGFFLYYAIFVSIAFRLYSARRESQDNLFPLLFAGLICYLSISFSGIQYYSSSFLAFIAISASLIRQRNAGIYA